jgi:hypothetical protein
MKYRSDLPAWTVPLGLFQNFDHGAEIKSSIPMSWNLEVDDYISYGAGSNISGFARVVSVGKTRNHRNTCGLIKID